MDEDRKILFFDIDGTLVTEDDKRWFPDSAKRAIKEAKERGHLVFINTGRVFCNVTEEIRAAGFHGYVCGCGTYIRYGDEVLLHHKLNRDLCLFVLDMCRRYHMFAFYEYADSVAVDEASMSHGPLKNIVEIFRNTGITVDTEINRERFIFDKFCAWYEADNPYLPAFKKELAKDFFFIDRGGNFCEIVPKGFSKATGIKFLLDYFNIPIENAYAFGDGDNDEPMLSYVPNSIIMNKGPAYLKKIVKYVTDDAENDGIYHAMKKLEII